MTLLSPSARELLDLGAEEFARRYAALGEAEQAVIRAEALRLKRAIEYRAPGDLAIAMDPVTIQTPALELIDSKLIEIGRAIGVMYRRRARLSQLADQGVSTKLAIPQVTEEIPSEGISRLIVSMPWQEGKSTRVNRYGIEWFLRQYPQLRITLISYDGVNANRMSYQIRGDIDLFDGQHGNIDLGLRLVPDQKAMGRWLLKSGGGVYAIGIGGGLTGHPSDFGSIDDPVKDLRAAESVLLSEQQIEWYQTTFRPRLAPWAPVIITTTRWADNDLVGRLTDARDEARASGSKDFDDWEVVNISAQAGHDPLKGETDILGREPNEFMISARGRSQQDWETTKNETSARYWQCMYQGNPTPGVGTILLKEWWRRYDSPLWTRHTDGTFRVVGHRLHQSWDMTFKDTKGTDYVVGQVWAKKGIDSFLVYQVRARLDFPSTIDAVRRVSAMFPECTSKFIEDKANGPAVISSLRHEIAGIVEINPKDSKTARAEAVSPFVRAGNFHLPSSRVASMTPELSFDVEGFINECTAFDKGSHDDQVDAFTQYANEIYVGAFAGASRFLADITITCSSCGRVNERNVSRCIYCQHDLAGNEVPLQTFGGMRA